MVVRIENGEFNLSAEGEIILCQAGDCIRDAYIMASRRHFPFSGKVPPLKFFETAQYNSWMELDYHQNQEDILKYGVKIISYEYADPIENTFEEELTFSHFVPSIN